MIDCHIHSNFSHDSFLKPEEIIESYINLGAQHIAITDHYDVDYLYGTAEFKIIDQLDIEKYVSTIKELQIVYKDKIEIALGIECGYYNKANAQYIESLSKYDFDIILNSIHSIDGQDCYFPCFFNNRTKEVAYKKYLEGIIESIDAPYDYDVITHIGYVMRKAPFEDTTMNYSEYKNYFDEILTKIIKKEKSLEINTQTKGLGCNFLPTTDIVNRYYELGGRLITIGSDAHQAVRYAENFDLAYTELKEIGFKEIFKYINRKPIAVKL